MALELTVAARTKAQIALVNFMIDVVVSVWGVGSVVEWGRRVPL